MPSRESGTAAPVATTAERRRRKTAVTAMTSPMESSSVACTSSTLARMVVERSRSTSTSTPPGSQRPRLGIIARTLSTTSITFASACLNTTMKAAGRPFTEPPWRRSRWSSMTRPMASIRTMAPPFWRTTTLPNSSGVRSLSFTVMVAACAGPSISPVGWLILAWEIACRTASRPMPAARARPGSIAMRIAGCSPPATITWETPGTWAMRGATMLSAAS